MVSCGLPSSAGRDALIAAQKKQKPLIRYAGSAAETSIGSKPIGSELESEFYSGRRFCQVRPPFGSGTVLLDMWRDIDDSRVIASDRYIGTGPMNLRPLSTTGQQIWAIEGAWVPVCPATHTQPDSSHHHLRWNDHLKSIKTGTTP